MEANQTRTIGVLLGCLYVFGVNGSAAELPIQTFFRKPQFQAVRISPNGKHVAALAPFNGNMNLRVVNLQTREQKDITQIEQGDVEHFQWVNDERIVYQLRVTRTNAGALYAVNRDGSRPRTLVKSAQEQLADDRYVILPNEVLKTFPATGEILLTALEGSVYDLGDEYPDVYRIDTYSGKRKRVVKNPGKVINWVADHANVIRVGTSLEKEGTKLIYRADEQAPWTTLAQFGPDDPDFVPLAFGPGRDLLYVVSNLRRDTRAVYEYDLAKRALGKLVFEDPRYDVDGLIFARDSSTPKLLGISYNAQRPQIHWVDPQLRDVSQAIDEALPGVCNHIVQTSVDGTTGIVISFGARHPGSFYVMYFGENRLEKLADSAEWIKPSQMCESQPIQYQSRDGLTIHGYLTLPKDGPTNNLPLVLNPHGGPWVRDSWAFNPEVQFLANRGFAVLQPNYRGSTGYGRTFFRAGFQQWGLKMQDDLTDAVRWAIAQGIADSNRVAICGASYGGYAAMAGLAFTPELYRCGANFFGLTDLLADVRFLLRSPVIGKFKTGKSTLYSMVGDPKKDKDRLLATSPAYHVDAIRAPVFMVYGMLDDRVQVEQGLKLDKALTKAKKPHEVFALPREGHGIEKESTRYEVYRELEKFLKTHLQTATPSQN
jgi:dipeptidyl aminopeptidase/acylaminoacyl peptidase